MDSVGRAFAGVGFVDMSSVAMTSVNVNVKTFVNVYLKY